MNLRTFARSASRVLRTRYPGFVFGLSSQGPPEVFCYHEVDRETFAEDLRFLRNNGYGTLTTAEFCERASSGRGADRSVLLTFDDARGNFWDVAFPLLQEFGARATLFAPTAWMGGAGGETEAETEAPPGMFTSWDQLRACDHSGLVDVQAHGHRHALINTSNRLIGFATPALVRRHHIYDWPMRYQNGRNVLGVPPLGTPVYEAEPLLSARWRVLEDDRADQACRDLVQRAGAEEFFRRPDAAALLRQAHAEALSRGSGFRTLEGSEFEQLVRAEFERSSQALRHSLGKAPTFFAFPWMLGSALSLRFAAEAGLRAVFGVGFDFRRARRLQGPIAGFGRLKSDWVRSLPGNGRRTLLEVVPEKIKGVFGSQHLAH